MKERSVVPSNGVIRDPFCFISNLDSMMFLNQLNYGNYWKRMLEGSKNIFTEIPITLLELKIISQICGKIIRNTS
jgi:hypothetical protein